MLSKNDAKEDKIIPFAAKRREELKEMIFNTNFSSYGCKGTTEISFPQIEFLIVKH